MMIKLDKTIYTKEVLLKTAYSFTDRAYLHLSQDSQSWIVDWKEKEDAEVNSGDFENELISQQLREQILAETLEIRKLSLARAFASTIINQGEQNEESDDICSDSNDENAEDVLKGWFDQHDGV